LNTVGDRHLSYAQRPTLQRRAVQPTTSHNLVALHRVPAEVHFAAPLPVQSGVQEPLAHLAPAPDPVPTVARGPGSTPTHPSHRSMTALRHRPALVRPPWRRWLRSTRPGR